jgi:hypothetical protein
MSASFGTCSRLIKVLAFDRKCESRSQKFAQKRFCSIPQIHNTHLIDISLDGQSQTFLVKQA